MSSSRIGSFSATLAGLAVSLLLFASLGIAAIAAPGEALAADLSAGQSATDMLAAQSDNAPTWKLIKSKATIRSYLSTKRVYLKDPKGALWTTPSAYSSNTGVVEVAGVNYDSTKHKYYVELRKKGVGKAAVTITDYDGLSRKLKVTCKPTALKVYYDKYTFSKKNPSSSISLSPQYEYDGTASYEPDNVIKRVKNTNQKVATAKLVKNEYGSYVTITPKRTGKTKVTVIDQYGNKRVVSIAVKSNYFKANLEYRSSSSGYYGSKEIKAWTAPKAKVTLKIGSEKKTKRANKDGSVIFKVKKLYKLDKKYSVTYKTAKAKVTKKHQIRSQVSSNFGTFYSCERYVPVTVRHVTKGDVITLSSATESYTRTIYSNMETYNTTFYFNYTMQNYYALHLKVHNKYGQQLHTYDYTIRWQ